MAEDKIQEDSQGSAQEEPQDEVGAALRLRVQGYGMLARLFQKEVDIDVLREMQGMRFPVATGNELVDSGYRQLYDYLKGAWDDSVTELAIDYVRTFIGHGVNGYSAAYPFESVYTSERRLLMQEARKEVLETLRENGLKRGKWNEGEDHIALELEFMQRKGIQAADAHEAGDDDAALEALKVSDTFAKNHILNWLPMLTSDMRQFAHTGFYKGLADLALGFVQNDVELLEELIAS